MLATRCAIVGGRTARSSVNETDHRVVRLRVDCWHAFLACDAVSQFAEGVPRRAVVSERHLSRDHSGARVRLRRRILAELACTLDTAMLAELASAAEDIVAGSAAPRVWRSVR